MVRSTAVSRQTLSEGSTNTIQAVEGQNTHAPDGLFVFWSVTHPAASHVP